MKFIKRVIPKLFIVLFSLIFTLLALELLVKVFFHQTTYSEAKKYAMSCFEPSKENVYQLKKNYDCRMVHELKDFDTMARINSLGYRGKEFNIDKKPGTKRILMLGDSMTFGYGVSDKETYPYQVESILFKNGQKDFEVINAGFADGFSPDSFYLYLKNHGLKLDPDLIVVNLFVWNDISDLEETVWEKTDTESLPEKISLKYGMISNGQWHNKRTEFKFRYPIFRESQLFLLMHWVLQRKFRFKYLLPPYEYVSKKDRGDILKPESHTYDEEFKKTYLVIEAMKKIAYKQNIPFLVVVIPGIINRFPIDDNFLQKKIEIELDEMNIRYIDLLDSFQKMKGRGFSSFPNDQHWNGTGARIAAETVAGYLIQNYEVIFSSSEP